MFKSNMLIHIFFMLILEFFLCYGVALGVNFLVDGPNSQMKYYSDSGLSNDGQINEVLDIAGSEYLTAYNRLNYDKQYGMRQNLKDMSIGYKYTEVEFKNYTWNITWCMYTISMILFLIFTVVARDSGDVRAAPPLCKVFDILVSALPDNPLRSSKEKRKERVSSLSDTFKKYKGY